ncbi:hypothetical protein F4810DRAFT_693426 [Camillea tinctor]|nr:hypothetical protein F4810DRAFT_693426 [Camillea tinctor]
MASSVVAIPRETGRHLGTSTSTADNIVDSKRWRLVLARATAAGFFYAVLSTRIFCLPSCPARRPRRANVCYFTTAAEASEAGFRPCRRCKPDSITANHEKLPVIGATQKKAVETACHYVYERAGDLQLNDLAGHVGLSPRYFHGLFKQVVGTTPGAYAARVRRNAVAAQTHVPSMPEPAGDGEARSADVSDYRNTVGTIGVEQDQVYSNDFFEAYVDDAYLNEFSFNIAELGGNFAETGVLIEEKITPQFDWISDFRHAGALGQDTPFTRSKGECQISECVNPALLTCQPLLPQLLPSDEALWYID